MRISTGCTRSFRTYGTIFLLIVMGLGRLYAGGGDRSARWLRVKVTAYCSGPCSVCGTTGITRIGRDASTQGCAVDPNVIALRSRLDIPGYGNWIHADDTGSKVRGNHIDIRFQSHDEAAQYGTRRLKVRIWD